MARPFDRSGIASLSDLETPEWRELFGELEAAQRDFLAHESAFRSPDYFWPRDPLHNWSRCWEYPFAFHHLKAAKSRGLLIDLGSGVTFFPFACTDLGYKVICMDIDIVCERDIPKAAAALGKDVTFRLTDGEHLPFRDHEADALVCVSVLEHIPNWESIVAEIARVLRPGGLLVLTFDLDLIGNVELGPEQMRRLLNILSGKFQLVYPERTIHPRDILDSTRGPYPLGRPHGLALGWFHAKQLVKPLLGRKRMPMPGGLHLAVYGAVFEKR